MKLSLDLPEEDYLSGEAHLILESAFLFNDMLLH